MHSASSRPATDLTARARIRDAAIRRFAADGMDVSLRTIAVDAGVSPGLIPHHFGSRAGLREACDQYVLEWLYHQKDMSLNSAGLAETLLTQLEQVEDYALLVVYALRCIQNGGPSATAFLEHLIADTADKLAEGVRMGTVRPSRDPAGRARLLVEQNLGGLLLRLPLTQGHLDVEALPAWLRHYVEHTILPTLELYTEPLFTDATLLNTYLTNVDSTAVTTHNDHE